MERILTRLAIALTAFLTAAVVVIVAVAFLCFAFYLSLVDHLSPPIAALLTAGGALLLAVVIVLLGRGLSALMRGRKRGDGWAGIFGGVIGEELAARAAGHPRSTLLASLLSGFALGASPELRHLLRDLFVRS